jgi:hypothetical protein
MCEPYGVAVTKLNMDLDKAVRTLKELTASTPERIRKLREEIDDERFALLQQRLFVKWYTWVTQVIEALGPDWKLAGDNSYVDGYVDSEEGDEEIYLGGEVEFYLVDEANDPGDVHLCLEGVGSARLFWQFPEPDRGGDLIVCGDTATDVAAGINEKVAELRAAKAAKTVKEAE